MVQGRRKSRTVGIDGSNLTLDQVEAVADGAPCKLRPGVSKRIRQSRQVVENAVASGDAIYGVNTGFGQLAHVRIPDDRLELLQQNLIRSHSAGVGRPLPERTVRAVLALRVNCLARGHSGLRFGTLQRIVELLTHGIHPVVPEQGSVGASGDLAPLAHIALALTGEGDVTVRGRCLPAARALKKAGLEPIRLGAKEGLALINGTQMMSAVGLLALLQAERLTRVADVVGALTLEALKGSHRAFRREIHDARPHPGQVAAAANLRRLLRNSPIERSHRDCGRVQDSYSLRCMPQVHGAARDGLAHVRRVLEIEINSSTDNPMVFTDRDEMISGGNFHGQPVSLALDHLATAACSIGTISERRIDRLLNPDLSELPAFLAHDPGLDSGFMLAHVTAAALVSENKILAHPASVDTIPTSAGKEDHVSMGAHGARQAAAVVDHVATVLAIELLCAVQALDLLKPLSGSPAVEAVRRRVRKTIPHMESDRVLATDIASARELVDGGAIVDAAERHAGRIR